LQRAREEDALGTALVVLISSDRSEELEMEGLALEAYEFLRKPAQADQLRLRVRNWLKRKQNRDDLEEQSARLSREHGILRRYFPEDVIEAILENEDYARRMQGENLVASALFFDIAGFTAASERLKPEQLAEFLNLLFTDVMDLVLSHGGSVNKLLGDGILATFGAPVQKSDDAARSVRAALAIRDAIQLFNQARPSYLEAPVDFGIGVARGQVFAGDIGSYRRREYTVIGDPVNTASRLQNLTRKMDCKILIDRASYDPAADFVEASRIVIEHVRGKAEPMEAFQILGLRGANDGGVTLFE